MNPRLRTDWLLLGGFCAFLFFWGLSYFGLIGADEPRYAQVAREMLVRRDWITPTLSGKPWLEKPPHLNDGQSELQKPPLYYWQAILAYRIFGVSDWTARLPSAFDATGMVLAVYLFLRRFRPGFHLDGALITAASAGIIGYARAASMDMALAATFTIALLGWYAWYESGNRVYLAGFYALLALGTLAKGPVAPFLAVLVIVIFFLVQRKVRLLWQSLWIPGIVLFCFIALPWYVALQIRNPEFFHEFFLRQNLARFGTNLYHHAHPFWYYLPVTLLALMPWAVFVIAAGGEVVRAWRAEGESLFESGDALNVFLLIWLLVPAVFFSLSQSKLPGYIVPVIPAGALLVAEYTRRHLAAKESAPLWLIILHSAVAALPIIPALMLRRILLQHRLGGQGMIEASAAAILLAAGMAFTLASRVGLRALRFVTLVVVVLAVAAILRIGAPALDATLSARPVANDISRMETKPLPLALLGVSRELEYGLGFYRNQAIVRYEWGTIPPSEHLLVAPEGSQPEIARIAVGRRVAWLGAFAPQHVDYYWVSAPAVHAGH